jgi:N-formylglutamate amidohydrolase
MHPAPFIQRDPPAGARETALIVEIPHAGVAVPPQFMPDLVAPVRVLGRDADLYVDELYDGAPLAGASVLVAQLSRYVIDLNRAEDDVDAEAATSGRGSGAPRGLIWRMTTEGQKVLAAPLDARALAARVEEVYRPYHAALSALVARKLERFGRAVILAGHSMPSVARTAHGDPGRVRADVVPGTLGRTSAAGKYIDAVDTCARELGWSVAHDDPYKGGFTTKRHGRPHESVHVVQVELARRLYMDETTLRKAHGAFEMTRTFCLGLVRRLGELSIA